MEQLSEAVRYERDGDLALVTISNPPLNLYTTAVSNGVAAGIERAAGDGARALWLRAEGRFFSAGVDVHTFAGDGGPGASWLTGLLAQQLEDLLLPTIASVHALCLTAAFEMILGCDYIIAAESAKFGLIETTIGLTPLAGGTQRLAYRAGTTRAAQVVLSGERFDAATFECWNIITQVVPDAELESTARTLAQRLAAGPTLAYAATKQLLAVYRDQGLRAADAAMPAITAPVRETEDHKHAVRTFFEQGPGKATFTGR